MTRDRKKQNRRIRRNAKADAKAFRKECRGYTTAEEKKAFRIALRQRRAFRHTERKRASGDEKRAIRLYDRCFFLNLFRLPLLILCGIFLAAVLLLIIIL